MGDGKPKYLNSPETAVFDKAGIYMDLTERGHRENLFLLCEGYMDVISLHQAGFTNAVASLGTGSYIRTCFFDQKDMFQEVLSDI